MILGGCRRGGKALRGGMVGEFEGYLWMRQERRRRRRLGEQCRSGNGVCCVFYRTFLGKASKIWEVGRKSVGNS